MAKKYSFKSTILKILKKRDGLVCGICGSSLEVEWKRYEQWVEYQWMQEKDPKYKIKRNACDITIDHKTPTSVLKRQPGFVPTYHWKYNDIDNLQLAHLTCNTKKGNNPDYVPS